MNGKFDNILLLFVTISFVLVGSLVVYFTIDRIASTNACIYQQKEYLSGKTIDGYEAGFICTCDKGKIVCKKDESSQKTPPLSSFTRSNLKVTPKYLSAGTKEPLSSLPLKTRFTAISKSSNALNISIEQEQKCTVDLRIPVQIGLYYLKGEDLYITNIVNKDKKYSEDCIVSVNYVISKVKNINSDFNVAYIGEDETKIKASICNYNSKIYADGDQYLAVDSCNLCSCVSGVSKCSNERVCTKK